VLQEPDLHQSEADAGYSGVCSNVDEGPNQHIGGHITRLAAALMVHMDRSVMLVKFRLSRCPQLFNPVNLICYSCSFNVGLNWYSAKRSTLILSVECKTTIHLRRKE
jgi:hypothetical protein